MYGLLPRQPRLPPPNTNGWSKVDSLQALPLSVDTLETVEDFKAISEPAGDLVANGRVSKFLIDRRELAAPKVHFINGQFRVGGTTPPEAKYHWYFARAVLNIPESLDEFNAVTYFTAKKTYVAGVLHTYQLSGQTEPIYGLQAYPQDVIAEGLVVAAVRTAIAQIAIPGARFAFVPTGAQQTVTNVKAELDALGVRVLPLAEILGSVTYLPLNTGQAWGRLRIFPTDSDDLQPSDIPVFDELPLDLSVVAGVLTRAVQDTNSHVNLKSKERQTPNAVLRDAGPDNPLLSPYDQQPVRMVVAKDRLLVEPTTDAIVAEKLAERMNRPLISLRWEPETVLRSYDEMASGSTGDTRAFAKRYGSKATNLAFLAHREVLGRATNNGSPSAEKGYDLVPLGFGVPLEAYRDFVDHAPNAALRGSIDALVTAEQAGEFSPKQRAEAAAEVQRRFMASAFPPGALGRIRAKLEEVLPDVEKIKVRSSANAEDVPNFDGAGLHDSYAADTDKLDRPDGACQVIIEGVGQVKRTVKPQSLGCAVKGVYASLWNKRAIEERSFARIDQRTIAMGLAIVPAYDTESEVAANAVVVTRVLNAEGVFGYSVSVQEGNNLVTNPDPGTYSETTIAGFISDQEPISLTVTRFAKPTPASAQRTLPVLTREKMLDIVEIAKRVERAYCRAEPGYYRDCQLVPAASDKQASLDLELKVLENGRFVFKQVREFGGR